MKVTAFLLAAMIQTSTIAAQGNELAPPTNLWAAQTSATTITLVWQSVAGAAQYRIFGPKANKGSAGTSIQPLGTLSGTATRAVVPIISAGMGHQFFIEAVDPKGLASKRAEFNPVVPEAKDAIPATVPAPSSVTATAAGAGVTVTWSSVPGATAYFIGRSVFPGGFNTLCSLCPAKPAYFDSAVTAGVKHIYTVAAISPAGTSSRTKSNEVTPTTGKEASPASKGPSDLKATVVSPTSVQLTWLPGVGATTLLIKRKVGLTPAQVIATLAGTVSSFLDHLGSGLANGVTYEVEAVNAKGSVGKATVAIAPEKAGSDSAGSTPAPKGPSDLKATVVSPTAVQLSWLPGVGASTLLIKRKVGLTAAQVIATLAGTVSGFLDHLGAGSLASGVSYEVEALNAKGSVGKATVAIAPEKAASDPAGATPAPKGPGNLKAAVTSATTIRLTWSPGVVGAMYRVMRQKMSGAPEVIATLPGHLSNFLDHFPPGGMPGVISYWIEAADGKQASEKITVTTDPAKR